MLGLKLVTNCVLPFQDLLNEVNEEHGRESAVFFDLVNMKNHLNWLPQVKKSLINF